MAALDSTLNMPQEDAVVKPGAKISFLDWFKLPNYDDKDPCSGASARCSPCLGQLQ